MDPVSYTHLQGCHRNGHAGGGHDGADEQGTVELRAAHGREAVERTVQQGAAHQRNGCLLYTSTMV